MAESNPEICEELKIVGVPSVLFFKAGKEIDRITGVKVRDTSAKIKHYIGVSCGYSSNVV
jgi:thioredoxin-like negative regulator of GroEL